MSVSKRHEHSHLYEFGVFRLDPSERVFTRHGERIPLAPKAFDTLVILVQHHGHVMTKDDLIRILWPDTTVEENNLTQQISQLRRTLSDADDASAYIETVPKLGYRFVSEVRELSRSDALTTLSSNHTSTRIVLREEEEEWDDSIAEKSIRNQQVDSNPEAMSAGTRYISAGRHPESAHRRRRLASILLFAFSALLAVGAWHYRFRESGRDKPIGSLAVLPFVNVSADPNTEYLSDGIAESLISTLSQLSNLQVMARGTVFSYKGQQIDPRKVGHDLNVDAVVTGKVFEQAGTLVIEADLVKVADGRELWGERYTRKSADLLGVQEEITKEISQKLRPRLSREDEMRLGKPSTTNPEAYRLYLKGRYFASKATKEDLDKGIGYIHQAIDMDPTYALAYDGLSYYYGWTNDLLLAPRDAMPRAKEAAGKALELDNGLPQAHVEMADVLGWYDWEWVAAEQQYRQAIQLDSNYAPAHAYYGYLLVSEGRVEEGIQENKRAVDLDPLSPEFNWWLGWMLYLSRRYDPAVEQLRKTLELDPNYFLAHVVLGGSYAQKGQMSQATQELERGTSLAECNQSLGELGHAYALSGKRHEAQKIADRLIREWEHSHIGAYDVAVIQVGLGDKDEALRWLGRAYEDRTFFMLNLKNEPELDPLRGDPRFKDLLRRMNFPK